MKFPDFLPGMKTYIAAAMLAFLSLNNQFHWVTDPSLLDLLTKLAQGLGFYGLAKKVERASTPLMPGTARTVAEAMSQQTNPPKAA